MARALTREMTQQELADLCGCSQPTISEIVSGNRLATNYEVGRKIEARYAKLIAKKARRK